MPTDLHRVTANLSDRQAAFLVRLSGASGLSLSAVLAALLDQVEIEAVASHKRAQRRGFRQAQGTLFDPLPLFPHSVELQPVHVQTSRRKKISPSIIGEATIP